MYTFSVTWTKIINARTKRFDTRIVFIIQKSRGIIQHIVRLYTYVVDQENGCLLFIAMCVPSNPFYLVGGVASAYYRWMRNIM